MTEPKRDLAFTRGMIMQSVRGRTRLVDLTTPLKRAPEVSRRLTTGHSAMRIFGGGLRVAPLQPESCNFGIRMQVGAITE